MAVRRGEGVRAVAVAVGAALCDVDRGVLHLYDEEESPCRMDFVRSPVAVPMEMEVAPTPAEAVPG